MTLWKTAFAVGAFCPLLVFAQDRGSLSGRVVDTVTGAGVEGATIRICPAVGGTTRCGDTAYRTASGTAGAFRIAPLPDGPYVVVELQRTGFLGLNTKAGGFLPLTVSGDTPFDLQMTRYASVRGRVFDPEGKPAVGVAVTLGFLLARTTNENGEFVFDSVPPQNGLTLSATPRADAAPAPDGTRAVTTYYPSVVNSEQAAGIVVTGGDLSYDIRLQTAWSRAIRGVVIGADGKPAPEARVETGRFAPGIVSFVRGEPNYPPKQQAAARFVTTAKDGTFAFPPVVEGEWTVRSSLISVSGRNREIHSGTTNVIVSTRGGDTSDIQNVEVRLSPPFDLEVTADWGEAAPPRTPAGFSNASVIPLDSAADVESAMRVKSEPDKPQRFPLHKGRYFIWEGRAFGFGPLPGFYPVAAMLNGRDVLGQVVELSGPASLKMIYKTGGGSVQGTVEKGAGAMVVLMADATTVARVGYTGRCDANGAFTIRDLPPGQYTALAVEGRAGDPLRPEFLSTLARDGKRVKVEAGLAAQVDLRVALRE